MRKLHKFQIITLLLILFSEYALAQMTAEDLLGDKSEKINYTTATFKASRLILGHTIEQPDKGELEFRISHRFGKINGGFYEYFGLDQAWIHFSLEYSVMDRLTLGIGRSNYNKTYDGYLKYALLRQQSGKRNVPLSLSYVAAMEYITIKKDPEIDTEHRFSYVHQLLMASKLHKRLSLQISPTFVHKNLVDLKSQSNDIFSLGAGGRVKVTNRLTINAEYFWVSDLTAPEGVKRYPPLSIGFDLETGGHVFQIMVSNSLPMREVGFITETGGDWMDGGIHLGFNISRMFNVVNH